MQGRSGISRKERWKSFGGGRGRVDGGRGATKAFSLALYGVPQDTQDTRLRGRMTSKRGLLDLHGALEGYKNIFPV